MSKQIKLIITMLTALLFLTACSQSEQTNESNNESTVETTQEVKELSLDDKINNKQQYIVVQKDLNYDSTGNKSQKYIEDASNYMVKHKYELKHQTVTFGKYASPSHIILTFEYKGD